MIKVVKMFLVDFVSLSTVLAAIAIAEVTLLLNFGAFLGNEDGDGLSPRQTLTATLLGYGREATCHRDYEVYESGGSKSLGWTCDGVIVTPLMGETHDSTPGFVSPAEEVAVRVDIWMEWLAWFAVMTLAVIGRDRSWRMRRAFGTPWTRLERSLPRVIGLVLAALSLAGVVGIVLSLRSFAVTESNEMAVLFLISTVVFIVCMSCAVFLTAEWSLQRTNEPKA